MKFNGFVLFSHTGYTGTGSLAHYHQSGNNVSLRVGNKSSSTSEAGVFHSTSVVEQSTASHGTGTAYCGRVFYRNNAQGISYISTGIGSYKSQTGTARVSPACVSSDGPYYVYAYCDDTNSTGSCPKGWGNAQTYIAYQPGCSNDTYYPNPTPASNTNVYTGSRTVFIVSTETCTLLAVTTIMKIINIIKLGYFVCRPIEIIPASG